MEDLHTDVTVPNSATETIPSQQRGPPDQRIPAVEGNGKDGLSLTFNIASNVTSSWKPPSIAAQQLMSDVLLQATGHCLKDAVTEATKFQLECLTSRVMQKLVSVEAPEDNRVDDYATAREKMYVVGKQLTEEMERTQRVKRYLKKRRRLLANLRRETQALTSYLPNTTSSDTGFLAAVKIEDVDKDTFVENMLSLMAQMEEGNKEEDI